jgi:Putative Actinobacterial Holin-X, holin superfamily III
MTNEIVALVQARAKNAVRSVAVPAAFAIVGILFVLFTIGALFAAFFFWLEPTRGPIVAALIVAAVALAIALLAFLPLVIKRKPPPAPQQSDAALPQLVGLMARSAPSLAPRQLIIAATLLAAALVISGMGKSKKR